jgi:AbrB family looped-hinge helix DNA binding protein
LPRSKVTTKYQVTIPREIRDKVEVRPGEVVSIEALSSDEIVLKRYSRSKDSLKTLIGNATRGTVAIEELEEKESR